MDVALARLRSPDYVAAVSAAELKPLVAELRRQRAGMVQTPEQLLFCYQVSLFTLLQGCPMRWKDWEAAFAVLSGCTSLTGYFEV